MAEYALLDDPEISCLEAIRRSKEDDAGAQDGAVCVGPVLFWAGRFLAGVIVALVQMLVQQVTMLLLLPGDDGRFHRGDDAGDAGGQYAVNMFLVCYITLADAGSTSMSWATRPAGGRGRKRRLESGRPQQRLEPGRAQLQRLGTQRPQRLEPGGDPISPGARTAAPPYDDGNEGWNQ